MDMRAQLEVPPDPSARIVALSRNPPPTDPPDRRFPRRPQIAEKALPRTAERDALLAKLEDIAEAASRDVTLLVADWRGIGDRPADDDETNGTPRQRVGAPGPSGPSNPARRRGLGR